MDTRDNLIPLNQRTKDEQRAIAKKGGLASGKSRREKADLRDAIQRVLDCEYTIEGETMTGAQALVLSLFRIASNPDNKGSAVTAFITIAKMLGQSEPMAENDDDLVREFLETLKN